MTAMGLLEPELKKIAEWLRRFTPRINSDGLRRILGLINARIDSKSDNFSPFVAVLLKQISKIIDDVFLDDPHGHGSTDHEEENKKVVDNWMQKIFSQAQERIKNAPDPNEEANKVKDEFAAVVSVLKVVEDEMARQKQATAHEHHPKQTEPPWVIQAMAKVFLRYNAVALITIAMIILSGLTVIFGVVIESSWVIVLGGFTLMAMVIILGVVLFPVVFGISTITDIFGGKK